MHKIHKENLKIYKLHNIPSWQKLYTGKGIKAAVIGFGACLLHKKPYIVPVNAIDTGSYHDGDEIIHEIVPNVPIYSLNYMDKNSWSFEQCMKWVVDNKIDVVCTSIRKSSWSDELEELSRQAYENGTIMLDSSDNTGKTNIGYPAKSKYWFAIGEYDEHKNDKAGYVSYGEHLDFLSPSSLYVEAKEGYYVPITHTSGTVQMETGKAVMLKEAFNITPDEYIQFVSEYSIDFNKDKYEGWDKYIGHGLFVLPNLDDPSLEKYKNKNISEGNKGKNEIEKDEKKEDKKQEVINMSDTLIGKKIQDETDIFLNKVKLDKKAIIINGVSYLPVRELGEKLGLKVGWDGKVHLTK